MKHTCRTSRLKAAALLGGLALTSSALIHPPAGAAATARAVELEASWEMNEPGGPTTMIDSGSNGLHAAVNQSGLDTGVLFDGATGYAWAYRVPTAPPSSPERSITRKGQSATPGGHLKIQNPGGMPSCLLKGSMGQGGVQTPTPINDNRWHVLGCVKTATYVDMYVDGVRVGRKNGAVGCIDDIRVYRGS